MKHLAVIPARYASTRFPGKPLAMLAGKPMIQHVYERVAQAKRIQEVIVATDDERICEAIQRFAGTAVMTSPTSRSGTERVAEVARETDASIVINVQGDEPLVHPDMIDKLVECLEEHTAVPMASLMTPLFREEDIANPNVVKVVVDRDNYALYFSRSPIPFVRDGARGEKREVGDYRGQGMRDREGGKPSTPPLPASGPPPPYRSSSLRFLKHLGLYGYQRHFLLRIPHLEATPLEETEQLEQLRVLEHGYRIKLVETVYDTASVDTPEDLAKVEARLMSLQNRARAPRL